jgi:hypothetical protein
MKITEKHTMLDFKKKGCVLGLDASFLEKVKQFDPPKHIDKVEIKNYANISIQHILQTWNLKDNDKLLSLTARSFGINESKIDKYPMIDFIRLTILLQDTASKAAELFISLKRESDDKELSGVLERFNTNSDVSIIDRFVTRCKGAYTHDSAADTSWYIVYEAFKADTLEYDRQMATNKILEKRAKNGTK